MCTRVLATDVLLLDAPSVIGWTGLRDIDGRHAFGLLQDTLQAAIDEGSVHPGPVGPLAHVLVGALHEAAMVLGLADDPVQARSDVVVAIDRVLVGIAAS